MADSLGPISGWERSLIAAEAVIERMRRAARALDSAGVPYAIVGELAAAEWVGRVDEGAIRNSRDVELLIRRADFAHAKAALEASGFVHVQLLNADLFLDGPDAKPSKAVRILYANEPDNEHSLPDVNESERAEGFQVIRLEPLVRMMLISWRLKDQVCLLDLIHVGLIDLTWPARFPPPLDARLQELLDNPDG
ncbi:MAG: hypothetical protein K2X38_21700 [Gemmataceae bacterium]|nr:hypothetical protein [Gemmataceae bacterium]